MSDTLARQLHPGMGQAVAERTILRPMLTKDFLATLGEQPLRLHPRDPAYFAWVRAAHYSGVTIEPDDKIEHRGAPTTEWETWGDVAERVAAGNALLVKDKDDFSPEYEKLRGHIAKATVLMSGRHLQHGDVTQPSRNQEVFTNCSVAATSVLLFYLLLNGSGVGRCYDDDMILVDWNYAPTLRCVLDERHPDFRWGIDESLRDTQHKYGSGAGIHVLRVEDSREGWAKAVELYETLAFEKVHAHEMLILDFSGVRPRGAPIHGMQLRPASGPVPLMAALQNIATLKGAGLPKWRQAMYVDHYLAECVLVGGARRAARMSTKTWRDPTILDFITIKRPIEFAGKSPVEVQALRKQGRFSSFLWSSNNSVTVDEEFWSLVDKDSPASREEGPIWSHAKQVWGALVGCAYGDGTGEPGIINVYKLNQRPEGLETLASEPFIGFDKFQPSDGARVYQSMIARAALRKKHFMIVNPCGEVALFVMGGYCVIADTVPFHANTLTEAMDAFATSTKALMRVNTMPSLYQREVKRTNRIGVGITGIHEYAWKFFEVGFRDLVKFTEQAIIKTWQKRFREGEVPAIEVIEAMRQSSKVYERVTAFWMSLSLFSRTVKRTAIDYAEVLGVTVPHTDTTIKPAGTTSKLFGLTEGWHLPAMAEYMRWVQYRSDDPLIDTYRDKGYPVRELKSYSGTTIVGFPTRPVIAELVPAEHLVLASEATPEEQFAWLRLGEYFYITGTSPSGEPLITDTGNQISYTLKYDPNKVSLEQFEEVLRKYQRTVKCASVMPQEDTSAYEYLPEEALSKAKYEEILRAIEEVLDGDIDRAHLDCDSGACPIDFVERV